MALSRVKTWSSGEVLTASDLNAEFNNLINNAVTLFSPLTGNLDCDAYEVILDGDADTSIQASTDDKITLKASGVALFVFDGTATTPVNGVTIAATATGSGPTIAATGSDTNIQVTLKGKGTGAVILGQSTSTDVRLAADQPIGDSSGNELVKFSKAASAVNEITVANAATGSGPSIASTGGDTNIPLTLSGKGTGHVVIGQATSTDVRLAADQPIADSSGNEFVKFSKTSSAVNEITVTNAATGNPPSLSATGGDTNIPLRLTPKGTGDVQITDGTDATKVVAFEASGLTTGTTRTITYPDRDLTLGPVLGTQQATTSGTAIDFTSIPSWVRRIVICFVGVSVSGTDDLLIKLGDAGGIEDAGYLGAGSTIAGASAATTNYTAGFGIRGVADATILHGSVTLTMENASSFTWVCSGVLSDSGAANSFTTSGSKSTSAALDRIKLTSVGGAVTFDAGAINVQYY